jgi:hypothetical protein
MADAGAKSSALSIIPDSYASKHVHIKVSALVSRRLCLEQKVFDGLVAASAPGWQNCPCDACELCIRPERSAEEVDRSPDGAGAIVCSLDYGGHGVRS